MTTSQRKLLFVTAFATVVFIGMSFLFGDFSSKTTSCETEDCFGLGITGWIDVSRRSDGWHVEEFHFGLMLIEMAAAAGMAALLSRGYSSARQPSPLVKRRIYYPAAVVCGIVALVLNCAGLGLVDEYSSRSAHAMSVAHALNIKYVRDAETSHFLHMGNALSMLGLACTLAGFICLIVALARREKGWYLILLGLLLSDIMLLMLL